MKKNEFYLHKNISGIPYMLPYGQKIADHYKGVALNESSSYIVSLLEKYDDMEDVKNQFFEKYNIPSQEKENVSADILCVLSNLNLAGAVDNMDDSLLFKESDDAMYFQMGQIVMSISGDKSLVSDKMSAFSCERQDACQKILLLNAEPVNHLNGTILVRTHEVIVSECEDRYIILFPLYSNINELDVSKDGTKVLLYYNDEPVDENLYKNDFEDALAEYSLPEMIFNVLRFSFLIAAQQKGMYVVHSASVLYKDKAWLFSGKSGEGKTTQTRLWEKYMDTPVINGDLNMIGFEDGKPYVYGIAWCGTSGICKASKYPLGGIIYIKQDTTSHVSNLKSHEKQIMFLQRIISPLWKREMLEDAIAFSDKLIRKSEMFRLYCTKDENAVKIMSEVIDKSNNS